MTRKLWESKKLNKINAGANQKLKARCSSAWSILPKLVGNVQGSKYLTADAHGLKMFVRALSKRQTMLAMLSLS
jgi:hypothetical protein